jgi:hypothetical protein
MLKLKIWTVTGMAAVGLTLGMTALGAATPAAPAAPVAKKASEAAVSQEWNFQKDDVNSAPGFGKSIAGTWTILAEPDHPGNKMLAQMDYGKKMSVYLSKTSYVNFEAALRLRTDMFERQSHNWQVGMLFRHRDSKHYYKLRVTAANVALLMVAPARLSGAAASSGRTATAAAVSNSGNAKAGGEQLLFFLPMGVAKDQWQRLGVRARGEYFTILLNGREIQTLSDGGVGSGQVGLYTYNTRAYFDDITINSTPVPKFSKGLAVDQDPFEVVQAQEVMVYYYLQHDGVATVRVLEPKGQPYNVLTKGMHSYGINSVIWDGQGLTSLRPAPGLYTLELGTGGKTFTYRLRVKTDPRGKETRL